MHTAAIQHGHKDMTTNVFNIFIITLKAWSHKQELSISIIRKPPQLIDLYLLHIGQPLLLSNRLVFHFGRGSPGFRLCRLALWPRVTLRVGGAVGLGVVRSPPLVAMVTLWLTGRLRRRAVGLLRGRIATGTRTRWFFPSCSAHVEIGCLHH